MSVKSLIQILISILIIAIIGAVYFEYFDTKKNTVEEIKLSNIENQKKMQELERTIKDLRLKNNDLNTEIEKRTNNLITQPDLKKDVNISTSIGMNENQENIGKNENQENNMNKRKIEANTDQVTLQKKKEIKNLVKDVEYISVDQKGNRFHLLATSAQSNILNNDILDLNNVRGKITSDLRDTIYIVSDFAQYNSLNLNSKFYENVVINYQDKEITCLNFDINMETNKAIAYNNVLIVDPKSNMKAGLVEFDLKTKNIDIRPENDMKDIKVTSN